jgi:tRNA(Ile)-lysidine synthase
MERCRAPWPGAVAVSGGGDSLALMHLLKAWAKERRLPAPVVLTVDHGLHRESGATARKVLRWADAAGLRAHLLRWKEPRPTSDVEAAAREARYRLMGEWCRRHGIATLYAGHTLDDQAETFLLRLARGSGLDGLSAMRAVNAYPVADYQELRLVRPLLGFERRALREYLIAIAQSWVEDPMNEEPRFSRVRIRRLMGELQAAGLTAARIADAASHLGRARDALDEATAAVLKRACIAHEGTVLVEAAALLAAPREVGLRALSRVLMGVSGQVYRPRFERLERLFDTIAAGTLGAGRTLHGCRIAPAPGSRARFGPGTLAIARERPRAGGEGGKRRGKRVNSGRRARSP